MSDDQIIKTNLASAWQISLMDKSISKQKLGNAENFNAPQSIENTNVTQTNMNPFFFNELAEKDPEQPENLQLYHVYHVVQPSGGFSCGKCDVKFDSKMALKHHQNQEKHKVGIIDYCLYLDSKMLVQ